MAKSKKKRSSKRSLFADFFRVLVFKRDSIKRVAGDESAGIWAALIILASLAFRAWNNAPKYQGFGFIGTFVLHLVGFALTLFLIHIIATKIFKSRTEYMDYFRALGAQSLLMLMALPVLTVLAVFVILSGSSGLSVLFLLIGIALIIWLIIISVVVLSEVYRLSVGKAIGTMLIAGVVLGIIAVIFGIAMVQNQFA
jgi:hypothetical protein